MKCGLETFIREWPRADMHRQSKFLYMIRQLVYQSYLFGLKKDELDNVIEQFDQLIFNFQFVKQMAVPQSLVMHVLDVQTDAIRFLIKSFKDFSAEDLKQLVLPIVRFAGDVTQAYPQLIKTLQEDYFNDFTDC